MKNKHSQSMLEAFLAAVEEDLLHANDQEMASADANSRHKREVRDIIRSGFDKRQKGPERAIPADADERRQLLASLIANQQIARPSLRATYGSKRRVSDLEVSALLRKLLAGGQSDKKKKGR
jgi:hypothetical protein